MCAYKRKTFSQLKLQMKYEIMNTENLRQYFWLGTMSFAFFSITLHLKSFKYITIIKSDNITLIYVSTYRWGNWDWKWLFVPTCALPNQSKNKTGQNLWCPGIHFTGQTFTRSHLMPRGPQVNNLIVSESRTQSFFIAVAPHRLYSCLLL